MSKSRWFSAYYDPYNEGCTPYLPNNPDAYDLSTYRQLGTDNEPGACEGFVVKSRLAYKSWHAFADVGGCYHFELIGTAPTKLKAMKLVREYEAE